MPTRDPFRGFVALPLPGEAASALEAAARGYLGSPGAPPGEWRVTPAARIHLTLKFLGDTAAAQVAPLAGALREAARAAGGPVRATLGRAPAEGDSGSGAGGPRPGWLLLPGPRDPRVLAVGLSDPTGTLPRMAALVEGRAESLGFPREGRPFLAHATVARRRGARRGSPGRRGRPGEGGAVPAPASRRAGGPPSGPPPGGTVVLDRLTLMESVLGPDGPEYAVIAEAPLGGA